jgi:DNA-binding transcriptional MerR regulator
MGEGQKPKQRQSTFLDQSIITFLRKKGFKATQIEAFAEDDKRFGFKKMFHEAKQTFPEINTKQDFVTSLLQKYHPEDWVTFLRDRKDSVERMCDLNDLNRKDEQVIRVIKAFYKQGMDQSTIGKRLRQTPKQRLQRQRGGGGMITSPQMTADQKKGGGVQQSKTAR